LGFAASNVLMTLVNTPRSGWVFALFHQVSVTLAAVLGLALLEPLAPVVVEVLELLELPLLHAATAVAVATASATAASARLLRMMVIS
jgi:hypothetical protein